MITEAVTPCVEERAALLIPNRIGPLPPPPLRLPTLDGVRGLAVLIVMVYHFSAMMDTRRLGHPVLLRLLSVGWCGVDLFFVLSGFLITGILWRSKSSPRYFRSFYMRRVLRIFPLYYGMLLVVFGLVPLVTPASPGAAWLWDHQQWLWLYGTNLLIALKKVHLATPWYDLDHLWSLAIEEHFYMLWPAVVLIFSRRGLMRVSIGLMLVSLLFRICLSPYLGSRGIYVLTPGRMDALVAGALLALVLEGGTDPGRLVRWTRPLLLASGLGLVAIVAWRGSLSAHDRIVQLIGYPLSAVAAAGLVAEALTCSRTNIPGRVLGGRFLGFLGKYSYGLYIYHVLLRPNFVRLLAYTDARIGYYPLSCGVYLAVSLSVSLLVAWLSYHCYETHFLRLKKSFPY